MPEQNLAAKQERLHFVWLGTGGCDAFRRNGFRFGIRCDSGEGDGI